MAALHPYIARDIGLFSTRSDKKPRTKNCQNHPPVGVLKCSAINTILQRNSIKQALENMIKLV
jgi:hypothetical protein